MTYYYQAYLKINKSDIGGNNISSYIKDAINLKLKYSDISPIEWEITNLVEYTTYYLLNIKFQGYSTTLNTLASSSNNNIKNYRTAASLFFNPILVGLGTSSYGPIPYDVTVFNNLNYLNTTTGIFTFGNTPNVSLTVTCSLWIASTSTTAFKGTLVRSGSSTPILTSPTVAIPANSTQSVVFYGNLSSSLYGDQIYLNLNHMGNYNIEQLNIISASIFIASPTTQQSPASNTGVSGSGDILLITTKGLSTDNPLYGNFTEIPLNSRYTVLPAEPNISPAEFANILSGSGTRSTVNQYLYELKRSINPRYRGSRITSDGINSNSITQSQLLQSQLNIYLNPIFNTFAPVNSYDTTIFEFSGGTNAGPEIPNMGKINIDQILNIDNTGSADVISPKDDSFTETIKRKLYPGIKPNINQYNSTTYISPSTKVVTNDISPVPVFMITSYPQEWSMATSSINYLQYSGSNYLATSSWYKVLNYGDGDNFNRIGWKAEGSKINEDNSIFQIPPWITASSAEFGGNLESKLSASVTWSNGTQLLKLQPGQFYFQADSNNNYVNLWSAANFVQINDDGTYTPQGYISHLEISKSMDTEFKNGVRWFVTLFDYPFISPIDKSKVLRLTNTFTQSSDITNYPLDTNSAYEIKDIQTTNFPNLTAISFLLKNPYVSTPSTPGKYICTRQIFGGLGTQGLIIWKSDPNPNTIILNNNNISQLGPGNILPENPSPIIKNNLNYLTKTFGNKP